MARWRVTATCGAVVALLAAVPLERCGVRAQTTGSGGYGSDYASTSNAGVEQGWIPPSIANISVHLLPAPAMAEVLPPAAASPTDPWSRYLGFAIDVTRTALTRGISLYQRQGYGPAVVNYNFTRASVYGARAANGQWSGVIGAIQRDRNGTTLGVGLFPVNDELQRDGIVFSQPILTTGLGTLVRLKAKNPGCAPATDGEEGRGGLSTTGDVCVPACGRVCVCAGFGSSCSRSRGRRGCPSWA
jgi:hypothetical protein